MASSSNISNALKETTHVSFVCQRCYQPLKMENSIYSLESDTRKELESSLYLHSKVVEVQHSFEEKGNNNFFKDYSPPANITRKAIFSLSLIHI